MATSIFQDVGIGVSLAVELPAALSLLKTVLPTLEAEAKTLWQAVVTPAEAIIADITLTVHGGGASVVTANAAKTLQDLSALFAALVAALPAAKTDASGLYAQLLPAFQPIASTLGITLPTAIFQPASTSAGVAGAAAP